MARKKSAKKEYKSYTEKMESVQDLLVMLGDAQSNDRDMRDIAREAHLFVSKRDGQWEPYWWNQNDGKPRYTFDMTSPIVDQIMAEIEQAAFDIRVSPAGGDATKETALIYDGVIRNIENMSDARHVYTMAARNMVIGGFDAWRVVQKYVEADSFDQDLIIEPIPNAIDRVWFDPVSQKQDNSDAQWVVVLHAVGYDEYYLRWPEGSGMSVGEGRDADAYYNKPNVVIIGELFYYKESQVDLVQMSNGRVYRDDADFKAVMDELMALGVTEAKRRTITEKKVCTRFFDGSDWLEDSAETVFDRLPIIPLYGNFEIFEDKRLFRGAVTKLLDPQRVMNYSLSREIEEGALAPRAKYWMTPKQAAGHETTLRTLNTNSDPVQFFNVDPANPGAPQQQGGAQVNPGLRTISEAMRSIIGQTAGMFAANLGDNPGLQSGVAIEQLQNKGDNGTVKYFKALEYAIALTGRILIKAIPKVYDTQRQIRLLNEDGTQEMAVLNQIVYDQQTGRIVTLNDLNQGQYDVVCKAGPSFKNRQEETTAAMLELAKVDPTILQIGGDLLLKNLSTPIAEQLAERKRAQMLAQGLIPESQMTDEEKAMMQQKMQTQGQQPDPNMVLAMAEAKKAEAETLNAQNNQMKLQLEAAKLQLESRKFESTAAVSTAEAQAAITKSATEQQLTQAKIKTEDAKVALEAEKLRLEQESLRLEQQRLMLETDIAATELRLKEQMEVIKLRQMQSKSKEMEAPKRARYNRKTGAIEDV